MVTWNTGGLKITANLLLPIYYFENEMKEKEKALELIAKYQALAMLKDFGGMDFEIARGCAIIGLDEMLEHIEVPSHIYQWFKQVRSELERVEQPCT
jgi:hypothetical protein